MGNTEMSLLRAENLGFSYALGEGRELSLFSGLDLSVRKGEILCLLGPSGCGKTTLLKLLAGFIAPREGQILYRDSPVSGPFQKGQMIFQDPHQLLPWLTVSQNVVFPRVRSFRKISPDWECESLLKETGLEGYGSFHPSQLSGGMKQRCALARSFYADPDILYMDEPFGSLDAPSRQDLQNLLLLLWKERGITILFVTHDIAEALLLSDRILLFPSAGEAPRIEENPLERPRNRRDEKFLKEELRFFTYLSARERTL